MSEECADAVEENKVELLLCESKELDAGAGNDLPSSGLSAGSHSGGQGSTLELSCRARYPKLWSTLGRMRTRVEKNHQQEELEGSRKVPVCCCFFLRDSRPPPPLITPPVCSL